MELLTWSAVRLWRAVVFWLMSLAIPVCNSAMRSNHIAWGNGMFHCGINVNVVEVQATVSMKIEGRHLLDISDDSPCTSNLLLQGHRWPYLMQLNTFSMFHDDVLTADSVGRAITPVKDFRYGDPCSGFH